MSYEALVGSDIGVLVATATLAAKQYHFVKGDTANNNAVVIAAAGTDTLLGVLQNTPAAGEAAQIRTVGISKVLLGDTVTRFGRVTADAAGKAVPVVGAQVAGGIAMESGVVGDIIPMLVLCGADNLLALATIGVAAGYKIARGVHRQVAAEDTVATGLATVVAVVVSHDDAPTVKQLFVRASIGDQVAAPIAGSILIKAFKPTAVNDVTPVAATDFTDNIDYAWIAIGT